MTDNKTVSARRKTLEPVLEIFVDGQHYSTHYPDDAEEREYIINRNREFYDKVTFNLIQQ